MGLPALLSLLDTALDSGTNQMPALRISVLEPGAQGQEMKPILVVGDAMLDHYWIGDVNRISPEAPVPIINVTHDETRQGAAANVVANIIALGGETLYSFCKTQCRKYRIMGKNQQIVRADFDAAPPAHEIDEMEGYFNDRLPDCDIVVFSDYGKGAFRNVTSLVNRAKEAGKMVLIDPKGYKYRKYAGADLVKPNLDEIRQFVGGWDNEDELEHKVNHARREARIGRILLTRAGDGMSLYDDSGVHHFPSVAQEVFDVTGAGDTAIATLAVCLNMGMDWMEAVKYANKAAGIVCGRVGTATATKEEVFGP